jgi:hypothetical protein
MWLFLTCRGEKYVHYHFIFNSRQYLHVSLTWGGGQQCKLQTSLPSGPILKIDCSVSHNLLASPLLPGLPSFSVAHTHRCDTDLPREDDIGMSEVFFSGTLICIAKVYKLWIETSEKYIRKTSQLVSCHSLQ